MDSMNSKLHRCGYCGHPTDDDGIPLSGECLQKAIFIIEEYGYHRTHSEHGECCVNNGLRDQENWVQVTRDMAIDAGDRTMEGTWIKW